MPVLFLIDTDNPTAYYFLEASLIFILSMSMLLIIAIPAVANTQQNHLQKSSLIIAQEWVCFYFW
jgi:competence protein ComGC